ncbi:hypothetical protein [Vibrio quintilis]|uniref:Pilus assembly protein, PilO n=1 Tax=Vibrio quintilis TaxID=1117707 RepID=A0A1M7YQ60_9VIBR|nr:hypothetical protein [Vibrio quintilis]SHO54772.1 hypothetical protein VQ7734_00490 [Vibrio quintilis]
MREKINLKHPWDLFLHFSTQKQIVIFMLLTMICSGFSFIALWQPLFRKVKLEQTHQRELMAQVQSLQLKLGKYQTMQARWHSSEVKLSRESALLAHETEEKIMPWLNIEAEKREIQLHRLAWLVADGQSNRIVSQGIEIDMTGSYSAIRSLLKLMIHHPPFVLFRQMNWTKSEQGEGLVRMTGKAWFYRQCKENPCE